MYLTTTQACSKLGVSRWTLARLLANGQIAAVKGDAPNSHLRYPEASLDDYLQCHQVGRTAAA